MSELSPDITSEVGESGLELHVGAAREPTLFSVLAERARGHPPAHLWGATLFGAADAAAILIAYPAAWWIACGAFVLCAFGAWGLADEAIVGDVFHRRSRASLLGLRAIRASAVGAGSLAALAAAFGGMAASLGRLIS
jgi:hypothetical protein